MNFNPYLRPWLARQRINIGGAADIQLPGQAENIIWQTRLAPPTPYENDFGDALETVFERGAADLATVAEGLNQLGFCPLAGGAWTSDSLAAELRALSRDVCPPSHPLHT